MPMIKALGTPSWSLAAQKLSTQDTVPQSLELSSTVPQNAMGKPAWLSYATHPKKCPLACYHASGRHTGTCGRRNLCAYPPGHNLQRSLRKTHRPQGPTRKGQNPWPPHAWSMPHRCIMTLVQSTPLILLRAWESSRWWPKCSCPRPPHVGDPLQLLAPGLGLISLSHCSHLLSEPEHESSLFHSLTFQLSKSV